MVSNPQIYVRFQTAMYEPQVDDYVRWVKPNGDIDQGWVYFKGDPVDNEKRLKEGWKPISQYITIETSIKPKTVCVYTSGKPMRHKFIHTLLLCNRDRWNELEYIKNRRDELTSDRPPINTSTYKSQEHRYEDTQ